MEGSRVETKKEDKTNTIARSVATNTLWGSTGRLGGGIFAFLSSVFLFRALGPDGTGAYAAVLAFFFLFNALADGGLYNILLRDMARNEEDIPQLVATAFALRLLFLSFSLIFGLVIFSLIPKYDSLFPFAVLAVLFYFVLSFVQLFMAVFQHYLIVVRATKAEITARFFQFLATAALFTTHVRSVAAYLFLLVAGSILQLSILVYSARNVVKIRLRTNAEGAKRMLYESIPVAIGLIFTLVYFRLDTVLLSLMKTSYEVGVYSLSYKILEQFIFFPAMFMGVLTPVLSRAIAQRDRRQFQMLFSRAATFIAIAAVPIVLCGWILSRQVVLLLGGEEFLASADPLRPLLLATALIFFGTLYGSAAIILGRQRHAIPVYALGMVVNLVGNFLFIPPYSYMGAAWVTVLTEIVIDAGLIFVLFSDSVRLVIPKIYRIVAAATLGALPAFFFGERLYTAVGLWSLPPLLLSSIIVYGAALFSARVLTREEIAILKPRNT